MCLSHELFYVPQGQEIRNKHAREKVTERPKDIARIYPGQGLMT